MTVEQPPVPKLGQALRSQRRERRLSLRDLAAEIGVSINTLSRVERGHIPDLRNFHRIADWLRVPAETLLESEAEASTTPEVIARHLRSDTRLDQAAAAKIAKLVEEMYSRLTVDRRPLTIHLRAARTFTPAANELLVELLTDMQSNLAPQPDD